LPTPIEFVVTRHERQVPTKRFSGPGVRVWRVIRVIRVLSVAPFGLRYCKSRAYPHDILIVCHRTASAVPCQIRAGHTSYNCVIYNSSATNGRQEGETRHGEIWGSRRIFGRDGTTLGFTFAFTMLANLESIFQLRSSTDHHFWHVRTSRKHRNLFSPDYPKLSEQ